MKLPMFDPWDVAVSILAMCLAGVVALFFRANVVTSGVSALFGYWFGRAIYLMGYARGFSNGYKWGSRPGQHNDQCQNQLEN